MGELGCMVLNLTNLSKTQTHKQWIPRMSRDPIGCNKTLLLSGTSLYNSNCSKVHFLHQHYLYIWPPVHMYYWDKMTQSPHYEVKSGFSLADKSDDIVDICAPPPYVWRLGECMGLFRHSKCLNHHNQRLRKYFFDGRKFDAPNTRCSSWIFCLIFTLFLCQNSSKWRGNIFSEF